MAYPQWVAPQPMDLFGGFGNAFQLGAAAGGEQAARAAGTSLNDFLYGGTAASPAQQPGQMSLATLALPFQTQQQAPQPAQGVVGGSHAAAQGATVPGLQGGLESYIANARQAESGGNVNARNPNSSATGLYQFTTGTWNDLMRAHPELGLTADGRLDPNQQERAMRQFTQNNAGTLSRAGLPVNPGTLYAAHFLGAGGATSVLGMPDNTPMTAAVSPEVINANPFLRDMTVGQFRAWSDRKGGGSNGGYQAPAANAYAGQGAQPNAGGFTPMTPPAAIQQQGANLPPREVMEALFRSAETRPMAIQMAQAAMSGQSLPQFQTFMRDDGSVWQMNTQTGQMQVLQGGPGGGASSFSQTPVFLRDPDGNQHIAQISSEGGILVNGQVMQGLPEGWTVTNRPQGMSVQDDGGQLLVFDPNTGTMQPAAVIQGAPGQNMNVSVDPVTGERTMAPAPGSQQAVEQDQATTARELATRQADDRAAYILNAIEGALGQSGFWTTGPAGRAGRFLGIPGAVTLEETVGTVKANLGFNELQAMRDASPNGGALGQVTERELAFLQNTVASLNPDMGEEALDQNLRLIANLIRRQSVYREIDRAGIDVNSEQAQQMLGQFPLPGGAASSGASMPPSQQAAVPAAPSVGQLVDGYRFLGGDPANPASWEPVQ